eukprot:COSAG04_NODE_173_length_21572_cov_104.574256_18_plen_238_part_00
MGVRQQRRQGMLTTLASLSLGAAAWGAAPPEQQHPGSSATTYRVDPMFEAPPCATTSATPTLHMPNSYAFSRTVRNGSANPLHGALYDRLRALNADSVRYMQAQDTNGLNALELYPEPHPPDAASRTTSWNMSGIEQYVVDFCAATRVRPAPNPGTHFVSTFRCAPWRSPEPPPPPPTPHTHTHSRWRRRSRSRSRSRSSTHSRMVWTGRRLPRDGGLHRPAPAVVLLRQAQLHHHL